MNSRRNSVPKVWSSWASASIRTRSSIAAFWTRSPLAYQTARDPDEKINLKYGTIQYPESYLIDRNGKVIEKFISSQPWDSPQMLEHVNSLL